MSRPGVEVTSASSAPPIGVPTDTSVAIIVAEAQRGPSYEPRRISSLDQFQATYGDRVGNGVAAYDAVDAYFHEGATAAYFQRIVDGGSAASASAATIVTGNTLTAGSVGVWGNGLKLDVVTSPALFAVGDQDDDEDDQPEALPFLTYPDTQAGGTFMATITYAGKIVQTSVPLVTQADLANFLSQSDWMTISGPDGTAAIAAGSVTLAGGTAVTTPASNTALVTALGLISPDVGPAQLIAPGRTSAADQAALLAHAAANNRVALLDAPRGSTQTQLASIAAALRPALEARYGLLWGSWAVIPGVAPGTSRVIPWSAIQAGLCAVNDAAGGNANQAVAGAWGVSQYALDLDVTFTAAQREALLLDGVNVGANIYGSIQAYGFRTLVDPNTVAAAWLEGNWARLNMAICAQAQAVGQDFVFSQMDGRGHTVAAYGGALGGMLKGFYDDDALFGEDPTDAYVVNVGPAVNTPDTIADGRLKAVLSVRMSPHAELVQIQIVKYPITVALA